MYDDNCTKAYALIWERCAKNLQNKVQSRADFTKIKNNPIELLKAVKEHSLNYQENRYEMSIILDSIKTMIETKQKETESLSDFTRRFKVSRDVMESHIGGPLILTKFVEQMTDYDVNNDTVVKKCKERAFAQFMSLLFLENSDQSKYGSLLKGLNAQQSLGNNQYPTTITKASEVLSEHPFDKQSTKSRNTNNNNSNRNGEKSRSGNDASKTQEEDVDLTNLSFAQMEGKCYKCGKPGHKSPQCRVDQPDINKWAINVAKINTKPNG
jgi:hypothetical protein